MLRVISAIASSHMSCCLTVTKTGGGLGVWAVTAVLIGVDAAEFEVDPAAALGAAWCQVMPSVRIYGTTDDVPIRQTEP